MKKLAFGIIVFLFCLYMYVTQTANAHVAYKEIVTIFNNNFQSCDSKCNEDYKSCIYKNGTSCSEKFTQCLSSCKN